MKESQPFQQLRSALRRFNEERDWAQYHNPRNLAMALSVEAGELLELYLWSRDDGPQPPLPSRKDKVEDELGDVLICLMNLAEHAGVDLIHAAEKKLRKNGEKYPVDRVRGRMEKYDEYS